LLLLLVCRLLRLCLGVNVALLLKQLSLVLRNSLLLVKGELFLIVG
jgi:hypothetical protein